jgi:hypothetical protein
MPILIRETNIKASLSDEGAGVGTDGNRNPAATTEPVADLEGQIQKLLLRKLKARDER